MDSCTVVASDGKNTVFQGTSDETVKWLEENSSDEPRFVYVSETADILTESEFLDLATDNEISDGMIDLTIGTLLEDSIEE